MAGTPENSITSKKVRARVINIEPDPRLGGRTIVSVKFNDNEPGGSWIQAFSLTTPNRPISQEELISLLKRQKIERPIDPFKFIKETQDQPFDLDVSTIEAIPSE